MKRASGPTMFVMLRLEADAVIEGGVSAGIGATARSNGGLNPPFVGCVPSSSFISHVRAPAMAVPAIPPMAGPMNPRFALKPLGGPVVKL